MNTIVLDMNGNTARVKHALSNLNVAQVELVEQFVEQIIRCYDPDVVRSFLEARNDPRIESILALAADLEDEKRDQLLFAAEDLYDSAQSEALPILSCACEARLT